MARQTSNRLNPRTEKAIKAWLKLPIEERDGQLNLSQGSVHLWRRIREAGETIAVFTLRSIIAKRYPKRKKAVRR